MVSQLSPSVSFLTSRANFEHAEDFAKSNEAEIGGYLVEPLLAAVIQDKLRVLQAVRLAAVLCGKSSIKVLVALDYSS
jgi:hypothetical protein